MINRLLVRIDSFISKTLAFVKLARIYWTSIPHNRKKRKLNEVYRDSLWNMLRRHCESVIINRLDTQWKLDLKDQGISKKIFRSGGYEMHEVEFICNHLIQSKKDNTTILDIGANIGIPAIPMAKNLPLCKIISFEPISVTFKILLDNISLNNLTTQINARRLALGSGIESLNMTFNSESLATSEVSYSDLADDNVIENVPSKTLSSFLQENNIHPGDIGFAWIDIQGHEPELIKGGEEILKSIDIYIEIWPEGLARTNSEELFLRFLKLNYKYFVLDNKMTGKSNVHESRDSIDKIDEVYINLKHSNSWASALFLKE